MGGFASDREAGQIRADFGLDNRRECEATPLVGFQVLMVVASAVIIGLHRFRDEEIPFVLVYTAAVLLTQLTVVSNLYLLPTTIITN